MTKLEIENCMSCDKIKMIEDLIHDEEKFYSRLTKSTPQTKFETAYYIKCIIHDFKNMHELFNKTK